MSDLKVRIKRDSVHPADDFDAPHERLFVMENTLSLVKILNEIALDKYLPKIDGGKATWIANIDVHPVAVIAQQWFKPKFIVEKIQRDLYSGTNEITIYFRYLNQQNPLTVYEQFIS